MKHPLAFAAFLSAIVAVAAFGATPITIAPIVGSNAVLQRDVKVPIWGTAEPGSKITVLVRPEKTDDAHRRLPIYGATAGADGKWRVELPAYPASREAFTLEVRCGDSELSVTNILFGDVWLCSGQSNMDMNYGWGLTRGKEDIEKTDDPLMRLFDDKNALAIDPLDDFKQQVAWTGSGFANARGFSACGWFFGQALRKAMPDVPIGLVEASWSGSPIRTWLSADAYCGADPACSNEYASATKAIRDFIASGRRDEYLKRLELWKAGCAAKGNIDAEGAGYDDSAWGKTTLPVTFEKQFDKDFDGCVWYRREFEADAAFAASEATITLGPIDDVDVTWLNGVLVGSNTVYNAARVYKVPAGVVREGRNVITVKAIDIGGVGGFTGKPADIAISAGGVTIPLSGEWRSTGFAYDPKPKSIDISSGTPTACYNAMIHPLFPMALKGAIWYQGCSDVGNEAIYDKVFRAMAADWRSHFTHPDGMPIYLVQLAAFLQTHEEPIDSKWAAMRWTQMKIGETLDKSGTAVAIDIGHHTDIHPKDKKTVGERLARLALARTYGAKDLVEAGPIPVGTSDQKIYGNGIDKKDVKAGNGYSLFVHFKNGGGGGLHPSDGDVIRGFEVKIDGVWTKVGASTPRPFSDGREPNELELVLPHDTYPETITAVRYAWDDYPDCNLVNGDDLPSGPFELEVR